MLATVFSERVKWSGSITWFRDRVRRLRPLHRLVDPLDRLFWTAGDRREGPFLAMTQRDAHCLDPFTSLPQSVGRDGQMPSGDSDS